MLLLLPKAESKKSCQEVKGAASYVAVATAGSIDSADKNGNAAEVP